MNMDAGEWRHGEDIYPSVLSKTRQRGRRCLFIISVGAGKILGCEGFCPNFPKLPRKVSVQLLPTNILPQRSLTPFLVWLPKKVFMCSSANLGRHFLKSSNVERHFPPDFQGFCPDSTNQNFWGCACTLWTSNNTAFHNSIIGNFVVYQDRLETNLL